MMEHIGPCCGSTASTTSWSPWPSWPTPSAPTSATGPSSACAWSTPPRRRRSARPGRCATPWTSSTSASSSSPATSSPTSTCPPCVDFHEATAALATIGLKAGREPARVRHRHHPRGRLDRALPREADLGPGLQRHHQHRHLRARAGDLRLHPRRPSRSTSRARSSPPLLEASSRLYGYVADGYWEDVGTLEAYVQAHHDVLDGKVDVDIPGFPLGPGVWLGKGAEIDPTADASRARSSSATTAASRPAPTRGEYTVLGSNVRVGDDALVQRAVVHDNAYLGRRRAAARAACSAGLATCARGSAARRASCSATSASSASTP